MSGIIAQNSGRHTGLVKASSGGGGVWNLIETLTSDGSDSDLSFTSGIDSTYDEYVFKWINIHPETDSQNFAVNFRDGSTAYDATKTSTFFKTFHSEADDANSLGYEGASDLAQGTGVQHLTEQVGNGNDECCSGYLHLFNPSSTTFVKHFISEANCYYSGGLTVQTFVGGYCNVTAAIDGVQFTFVSGEIQGGSISLYGIS